MEQGIIINSYLFYGIIGALGYLLWQVRYLNKMVNLSIQAHDINAKLVTESFEYISEDVIKLSDGLDKVQEQIQYVSDKQTGTTS
jgi:hypothetical protein